MKKLALIIHFSFFTIFAQAQNIDSKIKFDEAKFLKEIADNSCKCIDSIKTGRKIKDTIAAEIGRCIDKQVSVFQLGSEITKLSEIENLEEADSTSKFNIEIAVNPSSKKYKEYYFKIERHLVDNCKAISKKINVNDVMREKSVSNNIEALRFYDNGLDEYSKGNYENAIIQYKKAIVYDPNFAFAYDNLGICYRKINKFDEAIDAYEKSLKIDPNGQVPLQNICVAYVYKEEYKKAVNSYEKLAKLDPSNPEVFYGIGHVYVSYMKEYEKGLENLCKAYNIYVETKSPYRSDAEKLINFVFSELKAKGKEDVFYEILKKNNITAN